MERVQQPLKDGVTRTVGGILFGGALLLYLLTLVRGAFPGLPARLLSQHLLLDPFPPLLNFIWGSLVRFLDALPGGNVALKVNLFSAFCGAVAVWLVYDLVVQIRHNRTSEERLALFNRRFVRMFSGVVAALYVAVSIPFWFVATRSHHATFDLVMLLGAAWMLREYRYKGRPNLLYLFGLLYGMGITESATFIVFLPAAIFLVFQIMLQRAEFSWSRLIRVGLCALAGLSFYFIAAASYRLSPAFEWRTFGSYWKVVWIIWRDQYVLIAKSMPAVGWMLILMISVVPWAMVLGFPPGDRPGPVRWSGLILKLLLGAISVLVLFNLYIAPWKILGLYYLLITPYVLIAAWTGYLAGYGFAILSDTHRPRPRLETRLRALGARLWVVALPLALVAAGVLNGRAVCSRYAGAADQMAQAVMDNLAGRTWLLSNGGLDDHILLAAHNRQQRIKLVNLPMGRVDAYRKYVTSLFADDRLKGLAEIGVGPLLQEWFADPQAVREVAIMDVPDLWREQGLLPIPQGPVYVGAADYQGVDAPALLEQHRRFWAPYLALARQPPAPADLAYGYCDWLLRFVAKSANNLGFTFAEMGQTNLALEAFTTAREIYPGNISALLNLLILAEEMQSPQREEYRAAWQDMLKQRQDVRQLWMLASTHGYVRNPEFFASQGVIWTLSGKPRMAIKELRRALETGGPKARLQGALASLYQQQGLSTESEAVYQQMLEQNPASRTALVGLLGLALQNRQLENAQTYLTRARDAGVPPEQLITELALLEYFSDRPDKALAILKKHLDQHSADVRAWLVLALLADEQGNQAMYDECVRRLRNMPEIGFAGLLFLADADERQGNLAAAREHLELALRLSPQTPQLWEALIRLDFRENRREEAEEHVRNLLAREPRNLTANIMMGSFEFEREQYARAEAYYRTALQIARAPKALNDLAWILQAKGDYNQALALSVEAVKADPNDFNNHDTLGVILMKRGQFDEADKEFQTAIGLNPEAAPVLLHVAQLYAKKGLRPQALKLVEELETRIVEFSPGDQKELRMLVEQLRMESK